MKSLGISYRTHVARCLMGVALLTAATTAARSAEWPSALNLSTLNGNTGFRLDGTATLDLSGNSVASAGDVNGDGFADVIVGAVYAAPGGTKSGSSYVVFGEASGFPSALNLADLNGATGFRLDGVAAYDRTGAAVSTAGDINGDGFSDLIVGAPHADFNGSASGSSYVVFGKASGFPSALNLSTLNGATGFRLDGVAAYDRSGGAVSSAGDINGDGFADLIVGAVSASPVSHYSGSAFVVFGRASGFASELDLSALNGASGFRLDGVGLGESAGNSVSSASDVNGDGFSDLMVGAPHANPNGVNSSGSTYVVFGRASGFPSALALSALDGSSGFRLDGEAADDDSGKAVSSAGDFNGDGFADMIVGAFAADHNGGLSGTSYVVFGRASGLHSSINLSTLDGTTGFSLDGSTGGDRAGNAVSSAGDVNGDGFADLVIGAPGAGPNGFASGSSYVLFGRASGFPSRIDLSTLDGVTGLRLDGVANSDDSGHSVSSAGDVNGDGFTDLITGADGADPNGYSSGSSYVVFGRAPDIAVLRAGTRARQVIQGSAFADVLVASSSGDVLEGRNGGDLLIGDVSTTASYAHASASISASLTDPIFNSGEAAGDSYYGIANLEGSGLVDQLIGDGKANVLTGGKGKDTLNGGKGKDVFAYRKPNESPVGIANSDQIVGFEPGTASTFVDKIDLSAIDANTTKGGNQAFTFRGTKPFSGPGQIRLKKVGANLVIQGNVNASLTADFEIVLKGLASKASLVTAKDFKL